MERIEYFKNPTKTAREIKKLLSQYIRVKVYLFGSIVNGDYSPGLSDIDIAIVSNDFKDRRKKLEIYDLLFERYFDSPLEFHLLTIKQWNKLKRFIGKKYKEI